MINKEIKSLTGVRGIASLYVCVYHFYQSFVAGNQNSSFVRNKYLSVFALHGYLAVDLFFMLSAFVLTLSSAKLFDKRIEISNYKIFMQRRFVRIYPSYFFIVMLTFTFLYHYEHPLLFICSLTLLNALIGAPYMLANHWSLGVEWVTYLFFPFFYKCSILYRQNSWTYILIVVGLFTLLVVGISFPGFSAFDYLLHISSGYCSIFRCFGCYLLGIAAFNIFKNFQTKIIYENAFSIIVTILLLISLCFSKADLITELLFMLLLVSISKINNIVVRILSSKIIYFLGVISYPLYLIHFIICLKLGDLHLFFERLSHFNINIFSLYLVLCISLSALFTYLLELPVIKYLNNYLRKRNRNFAQETMILSESKLTNKL